MGDDSMRAKARATFGKEFMAAAAPQGYAKNEAVALQQRANARPIPTYKVGGVVKKKEGSGNPGRKPDPYGGDRTPSTPIPAPRPSVEGPDVIAGRMKPRPKPDADKKLKAAQDRASALGLKKGGKVDKKAAPKLPTRKAIKVNDVVPAMPSAPIKRSDLMAAAPSVGMKDGGKASKKPGLAIMIAIGKTKPEKKGKADGGAADYRAAPTTSGVKMKKGGVHTSSDTARKLATEMGGMKCGGKPGKYAVGGAGKIRKGQAPIKKAQGGAAKVRKGMMTPTGDITKGVKPKKGIGGIM